jgi:hypothetical protein
MSDQPVAEEATYTTHDKHRKRHIHALSGNQIRDTSNRAAADQYLRPYDQRDRPKPHTDVNQPSVVIKGEKSTDHLIGCQLYQKDSGLWNLL